MNDPMNIDESRMKNYTVLFREKDSPSELGNPDGFLCFADDTDHAKEQCENAYPGCAVVWISTGDKYSGDYDSALMDYYYNGSEEV